MMKLISAGESFVLLWHCPALSDGECHSYSEPICMVYVLSVKELCMVLVPQLPSPFPIELIKGAEWY